MTSHFLYTIRKTWLFALAIIILLPLSGCSRAKCPANNGGYIDSHKMVSKQKKKKPKTGLFPKNEKRHGF